MVAPMSGTQALRPRHFALTNHKSGRINLVNKGVSYSPALIGQDSDSCETLRSRQIFAPSLHPTYFLILSAPTIPLIFAYYQRLFKFTNVA